MPHSLLQSDVPLAPYSTYKIGGPARLFAVARTLDDLKVLSSYANENQIPILVIGRGSNCLFDDRGFDGLVIQNKIDGVKYTDDTVEVGAGINFSLLGAQTARKGFSGLEFASGIPGSVGGAVFMNAGAGGREVKDALISATVLDQNGTIQTLRNEDFKFAYRNSILHESQAIVINALFALTLSENAREKQLDLLTYRLRTQPYRDKSAGCVFRNPANASAGALIEKSGLKGTRIGDAEISTVHANFIINRGNAKASDILALLDLIETTVYEKYQIRLVREVRSIPYRPLISSI